MKWLLQLFGTIVAFVRHYVSLWQQSNQSHIKVLQPPKSGVSKTGSSVQSFSSGQMTMFRLIGMGIVYLGYLIFQSLELLYLIFAAWLISIAIESFIVLGQRRMPRGVAIAVSYLLFLLFLLMGMVIIVPFVLQQLSATLAIVIKYFYTMQGKIETLGLVGYIDTLAWLPALLKDYIITSMQQGSLDLQGAIMSNISSLVTTGSNYAQQIGTLTVSLLSGFFSFLGQIGLVITIAVFFSVEKEVVVKFLTHHIATIDQIEYRSYKIDLLYIKMGLWIKSQLGLCVYIAVIVYVVLWILALFGISLPNKEALALMAGFTEFIPYIGPLLGGIPALIVATTLYGIPGMLAVGIAYYLIQWTENNVLIPMLMNKSLGVSPLLIFLCVLLGGSVLGFMGIVLAVPLAVILTLIFDKDFE